MRSSAASQTEILAKAIDLVHALMQDGDDADVTIRQTAIQLNPVPRDDFGRS